MTVIRRGATGHGRYRTDLTPATAGWSWSGLKILVLLPGQEEAVLTRDNELLVIPLGGSCEVTVADHTYQLTGRPGVFAGVTDFFYCPRNREISIRSRAGGRFALATARSTRDLSAAYWPADTVHRELRGGGPNSRQVHEYSIGTAAATDHLLVCEVLTPGGGWSSYPPHKHDVDSEDERDLEEIYYFETEGFAVHTSYTDDGVEVAARVHDGDIALVPRGYHGPCAAPPGYDLYYLNVMAGPAGDGVWRVSFDPQHDWIRAEMAALPLDPRLPFGVRGW